MKRSSLRGRIKSRNLLIAATVIAVTILGGKASAAAVKELSTIELNDVEYNGKIYKYAIQKQYETKEMNTEIVFEEIDGFELKDTDYQQIRIIPETQILEEKKDYSNLAKKETSKVKETIEVDGNVYELKDIQWDEEPVKEEVSYTLDLGYALSEPQYPDKYEYTYKSPITKKTKKVILPFKKIESTNFEWREGFNATVTFHNLDGVYFTLGNHKFAYNANALSLTTLDYIELVRMLGYDTSKYTLNQATWSGQPYMSGGVLCRDAVATGSQYAAKFKAIYEADIETGKMYTAHATYTCNVELPVEESAPTYVMQATGYYNKLNIWSNIITFVAKHKGTTVAMLVFLILVFAYVLWAIGKKQGTKIEELNKEKQEYE